MPTELGDARACAPPSCFLPGKTNDPERARERGWKLARGHDASKQPPHSFFAWC